MYRKILALSAIFALTACHVEIERDLNVPLPDSIQLCTSEFIDAVLDKDVEFIVENWDERMRENVTVTLTERVISTLYKDSFKTKPQYVSSQRSGEQDDESYYTTYHIPHELGRDEILIGVYEDNQGNCTFTALTVNFNTDKPYNALKKPETR